MKGVFKRKQIPLLNPCLTAIVLEINPLMRTIPPNLLLVTVVHTWVVIQCSAQPHIWSVWRTRGRNSEYLVSLGYRIPLVDHN